MDPPSLWTLNDVVAIAVVCIWLTALVASMRR